MKTFLLLTATLFLSATSFAGSQTILLPSENGAYTNKADDGKWVVLREIPFHVDAPSDVNFTAGMTISGVSDAITNHNVIGGMLKLNILKANNLTLSHDVFEFSYSLAGNAGSTLQLPIRGESMMVSLPAGDYIALAQIYSPAKSGNNYMWRFKKGMAKVQIISN